MSESVAARRPLACMWAALLGAADVEEQAAIERSEPIGEMLASGRDSFLNRQKYAPVSF